MRRWVEMHMCRAQVVRWKVSPWSRGGRRPTGDGWAAVLRHVLDERFLFLVYRFRFRFGPLRSFLHLGASGFSRWRCAGEPWRVCVRPSSAIELQEHWLWWIGSAREASPSPTSHRRLCAGVISCSCFRSTWSSHLPARSVSVLCFFPTGFVALWGYVSYEGFVSEDA